MADAVPVPLELFAPPRPAPLVAQGHVEVVLVDVTRPQSDRFQVRAYLEDFPPPAADVVTTYILYGTGLRRLVEILKEAWSKVGFSPARETKSPPFVNFEFESGFGPVFQAVDRLARAFPP